MGKTVTPTPLGAAICENGQLQGVYRRCPHCGMVDLQHSVQGASRAHHLISRVGAQLKYECGKCRKQFTVLEICVPAAEDPLAFYSAISKRI